LKFWPFLFRELRKHHRFALLFITLLGLGLSGFLLVEALRTSVARSLATHSRSILSADVSISLRRPFTKEEEDTLSKMLAGHSVSRTVEFFSMLAKGKESRLVLIKAVDSAYPLFGSLKTNLANETKIGTSLGTEKPLLVVSPEVLEQIGAQEGDNLSVSGAPFFVQGSILEDPTQSFRTFALGGRAYLHQRHLAQTKILQPGSTATYSFLVLAANESAANELKMRIQRAFPSPDWRISTAKEAGESSLRALGYLGDFLGLVSLIALLLSSLGAAYLYRSYLEKRKHEIAIYRALGLPLPMIQWQVIAQTSVLALVSLLPAILLTKLLLPVLENLINQWSVSPLELGLYPESILPLLLLCLLGTPLLLLPEILVLKRFTPLALFREQERESMRRPWLHFLPALLLFCALAPLVARSFRTAGIFLGLLGLLVVLLFAVFYFFSLLLRQRGGTWTTRHAFLILSRRKRSAATVFLTLSLGSLLVHLMPQLEASLRAELDSPQTLLPSLFFFDIQQEQKSQLELALSKMGHDLNSISPLVRGRILAVNGQAFVRETENSSFMRTREDEQSAQFRNRAVNLSFRESLQASETIVRGRPFAPTWNQSEIPEISIESRFAQRLGVKLGDVLKFDVQGTEIDGKIVNERRVRWTSFQPNFFLVFQDGVLNEAPHSYLANIGSVPKTEKRKIQSLVAENFPNVSVIDVAVTIEKALELLARMRLALILLATLALAAGLSVLASVLSLEATDRARSLVLYRTLGASQGDLRRILFTESFVVSIVAVMFGALGSVLFTFGLSTFLFDGAFQIAYAPLFLLSLALLSIAMIVSWLASRASMKRSPLEILRSVD